MRKIDLECIREKVLLANWSNNYKVWLAMYSSLFQPYFEDGLANSFVTIIQMKLVKLSAVLILSGSVTFNNAVSGVLDFG